MDSTYTPLLIVSAILSTCILYACTDIILMWSPKLLMVHLEEEATEGSSKAPGPAIPHVFCTNIALMRLSLLSPFIIEAP